LKDTADKNENMYGFHLQSLGILILVGQRDLNSFVVIKKKIYANFKPVNSNPRFILLEHTHLSTPYDLIVLLDACVGSVETQTSITTVCFSLVFSV